jgi:Domain of unknown function (DUF6766)
VAVSLRHSCKFVFLARLAARAITKRNPTPPVGGSWPGEEKQHLYPWRRRVQGSHSVKHFLRDNGLSLSLFALFAVFLGGQAVSGWRVWNVENHQHGHAAVSFLAYLRGDHFLEAVFENWESEFLQMAAYVFLTAFLFQKGSAESKDPDDPSHESESIPDVLEAAPSVVRKGGWRLKLYEHSLSLVLVGLFLFSMLGHLLAGTRHHNSDELQHGGKLISFAEYFGSSQFWFESFQNWQSEFLAVLALVLLSIWLREKGSPESKAVTAPHHKTGK